jgi:hypothetical protein
MNERKREEMLVEFELAAPTSSDYDAVYDMWEWFNYEMTGDGAPDGGMSMNDIATREMCFTIVAMMAEIERLRKKNDA